MHRKTPSSPKSKKHKDKANCWKQMEYDVPARVLYLRPQAPVKVAAEKSITHKYELVTAN